MELKELYFCAKYSFTREAKACLEEAGVRLDKVSFPLLEAAAERIKRADGEDAARFAEALRSIEASKDEAFLRSEVASFPLAKILAVLSGRRIQRMFADGEAKRVFYFLEREGGDVVQRIAQQFFSLESSGGFSVPFQEFLRSVPRGVRLVDYEVAGGRVFVDTHVLSLLCSEAVRRSVLEAQVDARFLPKEFRFFSDELRAASVQPAEADLGAVEHAFFPPCINAIIADIKADTHVSHMRRFVLATFLGNIGMPLNQAADFFKGCSDFNERKTRYYLEHAYGTRTGRKYSVPSCAKMESYGLKQAGCECGFRSPLGYYKMKKMQKRSAQ